MSVMLKFYAPGELSPSGKRIKWTNASGTKNFWLDTDKEVAGFTSRTRKGRVEVYAKLLFSVEAEDTPYSLLDGLPTFSSFSELRKVSTNLSNKGFSQIRQKLDTLPFRYRILNLLVEKLGVVIY